MDGVAVIGLPDSVRACLFDLDGVLTRTAKVHAAAWKEMFDGYLRERAARTGEEFVPFDPAADYAEYVDGKPRYDGVRSFLTARGIELPEGEPGNPPGTETVRGLGNRKNEIIMRMIREGAWRSTTARCATSRRRATRVCAVPWYLRAPTPARCWSPPASRSSSRRASTGWWPSARG
jgi:beta-phosphoglucomutase-like phosphatase (HAD superfamily)